MRGRWRGFKTRIRLKYTRKPLGPQLDWRRDSDSKTLATNCRERLIASDYTPTHAAVYTPKVYQIMPCIGCLNYYSNCTTKCVRDVRPNAQAIMPSVGECITPSNNEPETCCKCSQYPPVGAVTLFGPINLLQANTWYVQVWGFDPDTPFSPVNISIQINDEKARMFQTSVHDPSVITTLSQPPVWNELRTSSIARSLVFLSFLPFLPFLPSLSCRFGFGEF